jgi:vacuolar protein sorting-associated protein 11
LLTCNHQSTSEVSTVVSFPHGLIVADIHGSVHLLNQAFVSVTSWIAHVGGRVTHMVEEMGILVSTRVRGHVSHNSFQR